MHRKENMLLLIVITLFQFVCVSQQCCSPPIWEGQESTLVSILPKGESKPHIIKNNYTVYYDTGKKMVVLTGTTEIDGVSHVTKRIQDYNTKVEYVISEGLCRRSQIPPFQGNCVPANATRSDSYLATGNLATPIQIYRYVRDDLHISMTVDTNCVLIGQTFYGDQGLQRTFGSTTYSNIVARFGFDPTVFSIPDICTGAKNPDMLG